MTRQGNLIGKQVILARKAAGLSQEALAGQCQRIGWDLSRDVLARIETGIRGISDKEMAIFSNVLKVPVQDLLPPKVSQVYVKSLKII
jgi:transcriptional regulator with XRE-family HTH domain